MSDQMREPNESDDLRAIVRYHGANDVLDAVLDVAAEVYGQDRAREKVHELVLQRIGLWEPADPAAVKARESERA